MIEGHKSEIRKLPKMILALQSLNKNQSKIQENVKNGEKITNKIASPSYQETQTQTQRAISRRTPCGHIACVL